MSEPKFALVEVQNGYMVEPFNRHVHLCKFGWSFPNVTLFIEMKEVEHLRDLILN